MLVMALFAVIIAVTVPALGQLQQRQRAQSLGQELTETLRRSQQRSMAMEDGTSWGVKVLSGSFVLYAGASYAARTASADEIHPFDARSALAGISEVHYSVRGIPSATGSLTVTRTGAATQVIDVNAAGGIFLRTR